MSGNGNREAASRANAFAWRDRVVGDVRGEEGRAAADAHQVPIELIAEAATLIAGYIARGEDVVSWRDTIGELCGPRQSRRALAYLEDRGHIERCVDRELFRPIGVLPPELPLRNG
jgi:hypothetical protein